MKKIVSTELTDENIASVLGLLADASRKLENLRARLSDEQLKKPLDKGKRSPTEVLAHLLHCEAISAEFIYLALLKKEDAVTFSGVHPEREYGKLVRYDLFTFPSLLEYFKFRRTAMLRVLESLNTKQWSRAISENGKKRKESVYWRARSLAMHELEHLAEIESKTSDWK